jgi:hypothetical protein
VVLPEEVRGRAETFLTTAAKEVAALSGGRWLIWSG